MGKPTLHIMGNGKANSSFNACKITDKFTATSLVISGLH